MVGKIAGMVVEEMTPKQAEDARAHVLAIRRNFGGVRPDGGKPWGSKKPQGKVFDTTEVLDALTALEDGGFSII